jgi:hypothetical protein
VLRIRVTPGPSAALVRHAMENTITLPGWGLHVLDISLTQGSLLDMVEAQARAWTAATGPKETITR